MKTTLNIVAVLTGLALSASCFAQSTSDHSAQALERDYSGELGTFVPPPPRETGNEPIRPGRLPLERPAEIEPVIGDINGDAIVDALDLLALMNAWGQCTMFGTAENPACDADLNGDGIVGEQDLLVLMRVWG